MKLIVDYNISSTFRGITMKIRDFGVEIWMNLYENNCTYNLAETCVESLTLEELLDFSGEKESIVEEMIKMQLNYGDIEGSERLRKGITSLYDNIGIENITITHGAAGANDLSIFSVVEKGDNVVSVLPTYQQHYSIPEALGVEVRILQLKEEDNFLPDVEELKKLVDENTKLICINNPNNPSGALMDENLLKEIVEVAKINDSYVLCDEAYRGLNHEGDYFEKSIVDLYDKGIGTASMSKTFSLAGVRIGWVAANEEVIELVNRRRDYNIISCGKIDDRLATVAIENKDKILKRNHDIVRSNIKILDEWVNNEPLISYVKPKAGTTAFLKYDIDMPSEKLCVDLLEKKGVMLVPGTALDMEGYLRIGYAYSPSNLKIGLGKLSEYLSEIKK